MALLFLLFACCLGLQYFPNPIQNLSYSYGVFVGGIFFFFFYSFWSHCFAGQFFASQRVHGSEGGHLKELDPITPFSSVPLNGSKEKKKAKNKATSPNEQKGLGEWMQGGQMTPIGEGIFASGTVARMVRNESSVILAGSFQWSRCKLRSCGQNGEFSDQTVLRNLAIYEFSTSEWSGMGLGCAGVVNDLVVYGDTVLIGGNFSRCFNDNSNSYVTTKNVATWSASRGWQDVGGEFFVGVVSSLARDPKTGYIYAVGSSPTGPRGSFLFLQVFMGSWAVVEELYIPTSNASSVGYSFNVVRVFGDWIYVGGNFSKGDSGLLRNVVRVRTSDLYVDTMSGGVSGPVNDIASYANGTVIVGGSFHTVTDPSPLQQVNCLAIFSEPPVGKGMWAPFHNFLPTLGSDAWEVQSIDVLSDGAVVVGGFFQKVGVNATAVNNIAVFSQGVWQPVGPPGSDAQLENFTVFSTVFTGKNEVLAFGYSPESGDNMLASYLESEGWIFVRQALLESGTVLCAGVSGRHGLALGGNFVSNGTAPVRSLALWNGTSIAPLGGGVVGTIQGLAFLGDKLFVIGSFSLPSDSRKHHFGAFNMLSQNWSFPQGLNARGLKCIHVVGELVFVGGSFVVPANNVSSGAEIIAVFETLGGTFGSVAPSSTLSWGPSSTIWAIADNGTHVFVAGQFRLNTTIGLFYNLACLELLTNSWVPFAVTCENDDACGGDSINSIAWSVDRLYVGGNFSYIGSGIRTKVDNVAMLKDNVWLQLQPGLPDRYVNTLAVTQADSSVMIACGGPGFLLMYDFSDQDWVELDSDWTFSFKVYTIYVLLPFYFARPYVSLEWTGTVIGLAVLMLAFFVVGLTIVIVLMRRRGRSSHIQDYSMLDVNAHDEDAWLIDYEALKIHNPPIGKGAYSVVNRAVLKGTVVAVKTYVGQDYYGDLKGIKCFC